MTERLLDAFLRGLHRGQKGKLDAGARHLLALLLPVLAVGSHCVTALLAAAPASGPMALSFPRVFTYFIFLEMTAMSCAPSTAGNRGVMDVTIE